MIGGEIEYSIFHFTNYFCDKIQKNNTNINEKECFNTDGSHYDNQLQ